MLAKTAWDLHQAWLQAVFFILSQEQEMSMMSLAF